MDITRLRSTVLATAAFALVSASVRGDDWMSPTTVVTPSANGQYRVTVVPRLPPVLPGSPKATEHAGEAPRLPLARVEHRDAGGAWRLVWQQPLVNEVAPVSVLLADDASFLVTFDNWHAMGYGDDVVAIYDQRGQLVRKLSLEQILPPERLRDVPVSVSSRWWSGKHRLLEGDRVLELQVVRKRADPNAQPGYSTIRIRLADGRLQ